MHFCAILFAIFMPWSAQAANEVSPAFTLQGELTNAAGTTAITDNNVQLTVAIYNPAANCLLYEETQTGIDLSTTNGVFGIQVGTVVGDPKRVAGQDPGLTMATIFTNAAVVRGAGAGCAGGYTSSAADGRLLRITVTSISVGTVVLSPDMALGSVPQAIVAQTLQGKDASQFIQVSGNVTQANEATLTGAGDASALHNHDSLYVKIGSGSSQNLGTGSFYTTGNIGIGMNAAPVNTELQVVATSAANKGVVVKGAAAQTANLFEIDNSAGTPLLTVDSTGVISAGTWNGTAVTVPYGGTGLTSGTSGGIPYFSAANTMASSAALTQYQVVLGGGAGAAPTVVVGTGASGNVLTSNGAGAAPTWQAAASSALSGLTAAVATNTIDNTLFAQVWNWTTATTQTLMTMAANALTTGSMLSLTSSNGTLNSTNGLLYVANTGASTNGKVATIQSNSTAGSGLTVLASGNVGVGTASPAAKLEVRNDNSVAWSNKVALALHNDTDPSVTNGTGQSIEYLGFGGLDMGGVGASWTSSNTLNSNLNLYIRSNNSIINPVIIQAPGNILFGNTTPDVNLTINPGASTSGTHSLLTVTGPAHTGLTASTESTDINLNLARQVQFSTGALATQRAMYLQAPSYKFVGASTITSASTMAISGPPKSQTNATITNSYGLNIETAAVQPAGTVTNATGLAVAAPTGATNNYAASFTGGNVGIGNSAPAQPLDVTGDINSSTALRVGGTQVCTSSGCTVSGGTLPLSSISAAAATNTIDNTLFAQVWNWTTATTQTLMTMAANALTTGSMLSLTSSNGTLNSTNGLLYVANTGASTSGKVAQILSNSTTAGSGITVMANGNIGIGNNAPVGMLDVHMAAPPANTRGADINITSQSATGPGGGQGGDINITTGSGAGGWGGGNIYLTTPTLYLGTNNTTSYTSTGATRLPSFYNMKITNGWNGNNYSSLIVSSVNNSSANNQIAYMGPVAVTGAANYSPAFVFGTSSGASSYNERMRISETGNLGINNVSPSYQLDVTGDINSSTALRVGGTQVCTSSGCTPSSGGALSAITAAAATNTIDNTLFAQIWNWTTATTQTLMTMAANALTTGSILSITTSNNSLNSTNGLLYVANTGSSTSGKVAVLQANSSAGSGITVNANGKVGINTAGGTNGQLEISGTTTSSALYVSTNPWNQTGNYDMVSFYNNLNGNPTNTGNLKGIINQIDEQNTGRTDNVIYGIHNRLNLSATSNEADGAYNEVQAQGGGGAFTKLYGATNISKVAITNAITVSDSTGAYNISQQSASNAGSTVTTAAGSKNIVSSSSTGTITNAYGTYATITKSAGTITNGYGAYIDSIAGTNKWGVYQNDATANNYFAGNVGINTTSTSNTLHVVGSMCVKSGAGACAGSTAGTIYATSTTVSAADYAEYFAAQEFMMPGDIVGLDTNSGKVRRYQAGDHLMGIVSRKPGMIGNGDADKKSSALVGLMGQLPFNASQTKVKNGTVYTLDGVKIGPYLSNGEVYINISSAHDRKSEGPHSSYADLISLVEKTAQEFYAKIKDLESRFLLHDQELAKLKEDNATKAKEIAELKSRMDKLEQQIQGAPRSSAR